MKNIEELIKQENLISNNETIGVACSGGRDSMALLHFLDTNKAAFGCNIAAVNIDHNIRPESKNDSMFVKEYCKQHNIKCLSYSLDVLKYCKEKRFTLEEGAREARYEIFRSLINNGVVNKIALGHHMQDQAETVLLNIFRGSGLGGASGMEYGKGKSFIRPLLSTSSTEIQAYIERNNIPYVEDETNSQNDYSRNYLRNMIMPLIRNKWPNADQSICKFADICRQDDHFINSQAKDSNIEKGNGIIKISTNNFVYETPIVNRLLLNAIKDLKAQKDIEKKHLEMIRNLALNGENGSKINLPNGLSAIKEYNYITLTNKNLKTPDKQWKLSKGKLNIQDYGIIDSSIVRKFDFSKYTHMFDYAKVPKQAIIRFRKAGDVFEKFGGGTKSLNDYLIDRKIPTRLRNVLPVLAVDNEILVIFGVEVSNKVRIDENTKTAWAVNVLKY
ncbi:MAG: tRNA lysidine(34) synthetase TilS [Clostridia bacterium]|nr:tRNA lysidine(34) synthetase TilS [Clostridia bacterium]